MATMVFVHGMFMTPICWEPWMMYFEREGYDTVAPPWPGRDRSVPALRDAHPDPATSHLRLHEVIAVYDEYVRTLPEPPILIGHSMGGLIVQILLARGLGALGVAIDSAAPR